MYLPLQRKGGSNIVATFMVYDSPNYMSVHCPIKKEKKRRKHTKINRHKHFVTSISAAALHMKSTHRNMFVYHLYIIQTVFHMESFIQSFRLVIQTDAVVIKVNQVVCFFLSFFYYFYNYVVSHADELSLADVVSLSDLSLSHGVIHSIRSLSFSQSPTLTQSMKKNCDLLL